MLDLDNNTYFIFGLIISLFFVTIISGIIAAYVSRKTSKQVVRSISVVTTNRSAKILSLLSCFGGGVFYAVCFLDIFPHVTELYEKLKEKIEYEIHLPVTQLLICFGFFFVYLIEEISIKLIGGNNHSHNHVSIDIQRPLNEEGNSFIEMNSRRHSLKNNERRLSAQIVNVISTESNTSNTLLLKAILFASIMSFHSILEGIAMGVKNDSKSMLIMFGSLLIHKSIESFSVGLQVSKENSSKMKMIIITLITYSFMTPLGAGIGVILQRLSIDETTKIGIILFLECLAAGTFIYVTFMEIIAIERENEHDSIQQLLAIIAGFVTITLLQIYTHPDH